MLMTLVKNYENKNPLQVYFFKLYCNLLIYLLRFFLTKEIIKLFFLLVPVIIMQHGGIINPETILYYIYFSAYLQQKCYPFHKKP